MKENKLSPVTPKKEDDPKPQKDLQADPSQNEQQPQSAQNKGSMSSQFVDKSS